MTSAANDEWDYDTLQKGIRFLQNVIDETKADLAYANGYPPSVERVNDVRHTIAFIEYNIREMEITPLRNNGDL